LPKTLIVYQLSEIVAIDAVKFIAGDSQLALTDGQGFKMNLTESTHEGRVEQPVENKADT
jgi:hypothetical protein